MRTHQHLLIFGNSSRMPLLFWELAGDLAVSAIVDGADVTVQLGAREHTVVLGVHRAAPEAHWLALADTVHRLCPVTAVVAFEDRFVSRAAAFAERAGIAYHTPRTVELIQHKPSLRRRLREAGVEDVAHRVARQPSDIADFGARHGWPVMVKPAKGTASVGVSRVDGPSEAAEAYARADRPTRWTGGGVLVERYLVGRHVSVETFSEDGTHEVLAVTTAYAVPPHMVVLGLALPTPLGADLDRSVRAHVGAVLDAVGVHAGPSFTELILTAEGPRVCEAHVRMAGDETWQLVRDALGVDVPELWARQVLGERVLPRLRAELAAAAADPRAAAIWFTGPDTDGELERVDGLAGVAALPGVAEARVLAVPGQRVRRPTTNQARAAYVRARAADLDAAVATARAAADRLTFVVTADRTLSAVP